MGGMTCSRRRCWYSGLARPQWSPPVMGGMTGTSIFTLPKTVWPQWSPPVMGGMTRPIRTYGS